MIPPKNKAGGHGITTSLDADGENLPPVKADPVTVGKWKQLLTYVKKDTPWYWFTRMIFMML
jgi:hypothetical protein